MLWLEARQVIFIEHLLYVSYYVWRFICCSHLVFLSILAHRVDKLRYMFNNTQQDG